jgi:hypothetical protein
MLCQSRLTGSAFSLPGRASPGSSIDAVVVDLRPESIDSENYMNGES